MPPKGLGWLALVFPLVAGEDGLGVAVDEGDPFRLAFDGDNLAGLQILAGVVADAEMDVVKALRKRLQVILRSLVAGPHVEVDDATCLLRVVGMLNPAHVDENDILEAFLLELLEGELDILHSAGTEVQGSDIINIIVLSEIDISHGAFSFKLRKGTIPNLRVGGGGE